MNNWCDTNCNNYHFSLEAFCVKTYSNTWIFVTSLRDYNKHSLSVFFFIKQKKEKKKKKEITIISWYLNPNEILWYDESSKCLFGKIVSNDTFSKYNFFNKIFFFKLNFFFLLGIFFKSTIFKFCFLDSSFKILSCEYFLIG